MVHGTNAFQIPEQNPAYERRDLHAAKIQPLTFFTQSCRLNRGLLRPPLGGALLGSGSVSPAISTTIHEPELSSTLVAVQSCTARQLVSAWVSHNLRASGERSTGTCAFERDA